MVNRLAVFIFEFSALCTLGTGVPLFADTTTPQPVQVTTTEHVNFAPGGTIRVNNSFGNMSVEGWDRAEVEVTVVKSMGYDSESAQQATHYLEGVHIATERRSDTEVAISTNRAACPSRLTHPLGKCRDVMVEYRIRVPRNSHLVIRHAGGYVSATGVTGNIEATNRRGDIVLMLPDLASYSIDAHTKVGVVTADVAGTIRNKRLTGEIFTRGDASLSRRLSLQMGFGGITIKEIPPEAVTPGAR